MKDKLFAQAKSNVIENLRVLQLDLNQCIDEGMIDSGGAYYNELSDLITDAHIIKTWDELMEIVTLARTLETDIDAWAAIHGKTSISLVWPTEGNRPLA